MEKKEDGKVEKKELRKFGLILLVVMAAVGSLWLWRERETAAYVFYSIAAYALVATLALPVALKPARWLLMKFAHVMGWFNTRLILIILYYLLFTPIGLVMRLFGKDLLNKKIDREAESYWIPRKKEPFDRKRYERQF